MVVELFPLKAEDLEIPPQFGTVSFDKTMVLEGVVSDNSCRDSPCEHGGTCFVTWNDFRYKLVFNKRMYLFWA
jgi:protein crumbs